MGLFRLNCYNISGCGLCDFPWMINVMLVLHMALIKWTSVGTKHCEFSHQTIWHRFGESMVSRKIKTVLILTLSKNENRSSSLLLTVWGFIFQDLMGRRSWHEIKFMDDFKNRSFNSVTVFCVKLWFLWSISAFTFIFTDIKQLYISCSNTR